MAKRSAALLVAAATVLGLQSWLIPAQAAETPPTRAYLAKGESLGDADYILRFGEYGKGTDSLQGTGMQMHGAYGTPNQPSLRLFDNQRDGTGTQKSGMYDIAYKATCCNEHVDKQFPNRIPLTGSYLGDYSWFDGTALWLGHSRFKPGGAPMNADSPPATGTRVDGTAGPADVGTDVRADDQHLVDIPVVQNTETKRSFLVSAHVVAPKHDGARYNLRPQPYLDRGGLGLTSPGGIGNRTVDLAPVVDLFSVLQVRADVVTNGGTKADASDDTGKVTYRYFLDNKELGTADTFDLLASGMQKGQGSVRFGPAFGLARGWQGDAPEVFVDNIAVYEIQNMPFQTSWIGKTILPEDSAKYAPDNDPAKERHVAQNVNALWVDPAPTADGKTLIYTNAVWSEAGNVTGVYYAEPGQSMIRPFGRLGPYGRNLGGLAVTGDADYVYATFPKYGADNKVDRSCIARYAKSAVKQDSAVPTVPFPGIGDGGDLCLPDSPPSGDPQTGEGQPESIRGLAASSQFLFLSHRKLNEIRVYRKDGSLVTTISAQDPKGMTYTPQGSLWAIVGTTVQEYLVNSAGGLVAGRKLTGLLPSAVSTDAQGRLYVANDASAAHQIQVFDATKPALPEIPSMRLGDAGGVEAARGEYGPARFDGLKGVAVDNAGNYYVASNGAGASPAASPQYFDVRRFNGQTKALEGQAISYISTAQVAPDPASPGTVYSPAHRYGLNLGNQVPGTEWSPQNTTLMTDRARCPNDARVSGAQGQQSAIAVRYLGPDKKKFMFVTGQGDVSRMGIYKFTDDRHTQTSVMFTDNADNAHWPPNEPTGTKAPGTDDYVWTWRDKNNDCEFGSDEYDSPLLLGGRSNWSVSEQDNLPNHRAGDLWISGWDSPTNQWAVKRVRFTGTFENGSPVYDTKNVEVIKMPQPFKVVHGLVYQSATDTLFVLGRTVDDRELRTGWRLARFDKFYENSKAGQAPVQTWLDEMPDDVGTFCPLDPNKFCQLYTLAAAGDRVYVGSMAGPTQLMNGRIRLYDSATGSRAGSLLPGPEVGYQSGWHDMRHAVTAMQLPDGRRFAFSEENFTGRILLYKGY